MTTEQDILTVEMNEEWLFITRIMQEDANLLAELAK